MVSNELETKNVELEPHMRTLDQEPVVEIRLTAWPVLRLPKDLYDVPGPERLFAVDLAHRREDEGADDGAEVEAVLVGMNELLLVCTGADGIEVVEPTGTFEQTQPVGGGGLGHVTNLHESEE